MGLPVRTETAKPSLMWFFVSLGLLLMVTSFVPSLHSRASKWVMGGSKGKEVEKARRFSSTSASPNPKPSPTPPAKPATPPTPKPSTPPPPAPPHH
jgi:hypothetical protein